MRRAPLYFNFFLDGVNLHVHETTSLMDLPGNLASAVESAAIPEGPLSFPSVIGRRGIGIVTPIRMAEIADEYNPRFREFEEDDE